VSFTWKKVFALGLLHIWLAGVLRQYFAVQILSSCCLSSANRIQDQNTIFCIAWKM